MTEEAFDDRYVRYREHAELAREFAELKAAQTQNSASLQRIEALLIARPAVPQQPQETALAAVLHRALDAADKRAPSNNPIQHFLALTGAIAIGGGIVFVLIGMH